MTDTLDPVTEQPHATKITRMELDTRTGKRAAIVVEWHHPGGGRGCGSRGLHRAVLLESPDEGEGAIVCIERAAKKDALGAITWTRKYCAPATYLLAVIMRSGALKVSRDR